jgi:hypothetical protein
MTSPVTKDSLPILTFEEEFEEIPQVDKTPAPGGYQEDLPVPQFVRKIVTRRKSVDLSKLHGELGEVQNQVDKILQQLTSPQTQPGKMRLNSLQVSVGISAGGSIGVVTAGMQASLTLVYERA